MKKYKHKITGNTAVETHSEQNYRVQNFTIPKWIVENSTDWEEIEELNVSIGTKFNSLFNRDIWQIYEEKEYEILSFINYKNIFSIPANTILTKIKDTKSFNFQNIYDNEKSILENNKWSIYSIKRISDGEIFTIGDRIKNKITPSKWTDCIITKIDLIDNKYQITIKQNLAIAAYIIDKNFITVSPIFKTEDGVDIYEGDTAFLSFKSGSCYAAVCCKENAYFSKLCSDVKVFSTKEKAQEYIDKQKILFVTKDKVSKKTNDFCFQLCKKSGIRVQIKVDLKFYDPDNYYYIDNIDLAFAIGYAILCKNNLVNLHSHALIEANNKINNLLNERK